MTAAPLKGQVVFKKEIAITMRRECVLYWRLSKAIRLQEQPWDALDTKIVSLAKDMKMSDWLKDRLGELRELNAKRSKQ